MSDFELRAWLAEIWAEVAAEANDPCPACPFPDDRPDCCHDRELS